MEFKIDDFADRLAKIDNLTFSIGCIVFWISVAFLIAAFCGATCATYNNYPSSK
jgi:hypothetical protein